MQTIDLAATREANNDLIRQQHAIISKDDLKPFKKRSDVPGLVRFTTHVGTILGTGYLLYLSHGTPWFWLAFLTHGVFLNHLFAPVHECAHGTAFRTRWLNEAVMWFCGIVTIWPPLYFRYDHAGHHTYAQMKGSDPEQIFPPPRTLVGYFYVLLGLQLWVRTFGWLFNHAVGRIAPFNCQFVPESERPKVYFEARLMLAVYAIVIGLSVYFQSWIALIYWAGPLFLVSPMARALRLADHTGCNDKMDLRDVARTVKTDPITEFFCWNMNYHCEHHLASAVPFHALPALHRRIGHKLNPVHKGYIAVQWEIITRHVAGIFRRPADQAAR